MNARFTLNEARCVACEACAVACMDEKNIDVSAGERPLRYCVTTETGTGKDARIRFRSAGCLHCENAPCIEACPAGCLYREEETGLVLYDNASCVSCHACASACAHGAILFDAADKMVKCDGCADRVRAGLVPACVRACPFDALSFSR